MVLTQEILMQIESHIAEILPELLARDPRIAVTIEGILAQHFPRRDEFARLLDEVAAIRIEMNQRFEQVDSRFEQIDGRFEQVDSRFEQVDSRFEQIDSRFEQIDGRFEQMDGRFEQMDGRFEQIDGRFEQMDGRFEQMDGRSEQVDGRLSKVEKTMLGMRRDIAKLQAGQEHILKRLDGQEGWIKLMVGGIHNEEGSMAEDLVAAALRYGLKTKDIDPESLRLRQVLVDSQGQVFMAGYRTEIDLIARNGHLTVFEIKAHRVKPGDVGLFALKLRLFAAQNPGNEVRGLLIVPGALEHVQTECAQYGIELVA